MQSSNARRISIRSYTRRDGTTVRSHSRVIRKHRGIRAAQHREHQPREFLIDIDGEQRWVNKIQLDKLLAEHNRPFTILGNDVILG